MKKRKIGLLVLSPLMLGMLITSCNEEQGGGNGGDTPKPLGDTYSLMNHWEGNADEEHYSVTEVGDNLEIEYQDVSSWKFVKRSFAYDLEKDQFDKYKKFTFTGKMEAETGPSNVMIKFEWNGGAKEVNFDFTNEVKTYELSLNFVPDWTQMSQVLFFVNPNGSESASGKMTFSDISLSVDEVNKANDIDPNQETVAQEFNEYNGGDKFEIKKTWGYNAEKDILTETKDDGWYKFTWGGDDNPKDNAWGYVSSLVKEGSQTLSTSGFKRIHFKFKGKKDERAMFKFEVKVNNAVAGAKEVKVLFTGEIQEIDLDITELISLMTSGATATAMIFPRPTETLTLPASEMELLDCYMDKTEAIPYENPFVNKVVGETIPLTTISEFNGGYGTPVVEENTITFDYKKPKDEACFDSKLMFNAEDENLQDYTHLTGKVISTVDTSLMIKSNDNVENKFALKANEEMNLDLYFGNAPSATNFFVAYQQGDPLTGKVTFTDLKFVKDTDVENNHRVGDTIKLTKFSELDAAVYQNEGMENGVTTIKFDKQTSGWPGFKAKFDGSNIQDMRHLIGTIESSIDTQLMIKGFNQGGAGEKIVELKANTPFDLATFNNNEGLKWSTKDISDEVVNNNKNITFIVAPGDATGIGALKFTNLTLNKWDDRVSPEDDPLMNLEQDGEIKITKLFVEDPSKYSFTEENGKISVKLNKMYGTDDWSQVKFKIHAKDLSIYNHLSVTVTVPDAYEIIVKPNNQKETKHTFNEAGSITLELDITNLFSGTTNANNLIFIIPKNEAKKDQLLTDVIEFTDFKLTTKQTA